MRLIYIIGIPGSGKTTLLKTIFPQFERIVDKPFKHVWIDCATAILGTLNGTFAGTDALPMNAQPIVLDWLTAHRGESWTLWGEGDRLGNGSFFDAVSHLKIDLRPILLDTESGLARRRAQQRGSQQNLQWVKGRIAKVERLRQRYPCIVLDGTFAAETNAMILRNLL